MDRSPEHEPPLQKHRRALERGLVTALAGGGIATTLGIVTLLAARFAPPPYGGAMPLIGTWVAGLGLGLTALSVAMSFSVPALRTVRAKDWGGDVYERLRHWSRLKISSLLLNLLTLVAGIVLVMALLIRAGTIGSGPAEIFHPTRFPSLLALFLGLNLAHAHWLSLRTPVQRERTGVEGPLVLLAAATAAFLAFAGAFVASLPDGEKLLGLEGRHGMLLVLAGSSMASVGLFVSRSLPTVMTLFREELEHDPSRAHMSRSKSVVLPTMIAFALLFVALLVLLTFGVGAVGLLEEVPRNAVLLSVLLFLAVAMIVSVVVSLVLARSGDKTPLYRRLMSAQRKQELGILGVSGGVALALFVLAALVHERVALPLLGIVDTERWLDLMSFGILAVVGPYGFYMASRAKRIRALEERFPDLLRDLAASRRAGLTLDAAVHIAASGEYGALTPEIRKMADQLSWNVSFEEALRRFGERVHTPLIERAVSLIIEAGRSGGHVTDVIEAAATDAREIKTLQSERRSTMVLYTAIIYLSFLVFLAVVVVLQATLIPEMLKANQAASATGSTGFANVHFASLGLSDFRTFYFLGATVQGLGNGLIAGLMETGRPLYGLRHSFILVLIAYVAFALLG